MEQEKVMNNAKRVKVQADIYYMSANLLMEEKEAVCRKIMDSDLEVELAKEEHEKLFLSLPAHCLYAFCSELYLKSLILESGNTYDRIHYLDDLYKALSTELQTDIENEYSKSHDGNLSELLIVHRKDFQDIRYACEGIGGVKLLSFVKWFADTLYIVTDKYVKKLLRS